VKDNGRNGYITTGSLNQIQCRLAILARISFLQKRH
jgi:hypothetical protein